MAINITLKDHLIHNLAALCLKCELSIFQDTLNLVKFIILLSTYREEGIKLSPKIYITQNIDSLTKMLPGSEKIKIGQTDCNIKGLQQIAKKCAPLAIDGWLIYIVETNEKPLEYGIFRGNLSPFSTSIDDIVMTGESDNIIVKIFQIAESCIEIRLNREDPLYVFLKDFGEENTSPLHSQNQLIAAIIKKVPPKIKETMESFLSNLLLNGLKESHGCLIAVTSKAEPPKFLASDGIILETSIDFPKLILEVKEKKVEQSYLESKAALVKGMLNSDGIILFHDTGKLLGYNCFIKAYTKTNSNAINGGARRRAFDAACSRLGRGLSAVFIQSQDGWTSFKEK